LFPMGIVHFIQAPVLSQAVGMFPTIRTVLRGTANDIETDGLLFVSSRRNRQPNCPLIAPEDFYLVEEKEVLVGAVGIEPTNLSVSPDDSIGLSLLNLLKTESGTPVLDRNWTENPNGSRNNNHYSLNSGTQLPRSRTTELLRHRK